MSPASGGRCVDARRRSAQDNAVVDEAGVRAEAEIASPIASAEIASPLAGGDAPRSRHQPALRCRLLLISNSFHLGMGFLAHCLSDISHFLGSTKELVFVPYALEDHGEYAARVAECFQPAGVLVRSLHAEPNPHRAVREARALFVGG